MKTLEKNDLKVLINEAEIQNRIKEMANQLNEEYKNSEVCVICVLKGSVMFMTDLIKYLDMPLKLEFIRLSSYGSNLTSSGKVNAIDISLPDLNDKNVLVIEDIIDTGHTAQFLTEFFKHNFNVKSYKFISLLDKRCKREVNINPDMFGFEVEDKFLVGYGLDYDGYYRNLRYIGYIQ
ncbi:hypoxanthine phosphoribosyltransferase [bacterium]|nr:hypoxanthine phosphoribosyltransferase [bacterium]